MPIDARDIPPYLWGDACQGWRLLQSPALAVTEELMPPGTSEALHRHARASQLFYVLEGELRFVIDGAPERAGERQAVYVPAMTPHRVHNDGPAPARFLVIASPTTAGDREDL
jgi:mannose-6-phosphate isomerase-like protein (cupin superfamily)